MPNVFLVQFEGNREIDADARLALKDALGAACRASLDADMPVAVDHLEPTEPHVAPLVDRPRA